MTFSTNQSKQKSDIQLLVGDNSMEMLQETKLLGLIPGQTFVGIATLGLHTVPKELALEYMQLRGSYFV